MADVARLVPNTDRTEKLRGLRERLGEGLVERDVAVRLALLAALAGEHLLVVGPPGTAKSMIARRLGLAFEGATFFERLLTRFTVPEELFGPLSIKGLEDDRYERLTDGYLPTASVAFLDEIFKANSAILNALLTLLNEREFDNGTKRITTPLIAVIAASNELPQGEELDALYDRFLLRLHVGPVSKQAFGGLLALRDDLVPVIPPDLRLHSSVLHEIRRSSNDVRVPADVLALLGDLREWCVAEKIPVSDRRWRKVVHLLQVSAWTNGRKEVSVWDCWLLQHCLWNTPDMREKIYGWYADRVGATAAMDITKLTKLVVSWEGRLARDQQARSQMHDGQGNLLFEDVEGGPTTATKGKCRKTRDGAPLFLAPEGTVTDRGNGGKGYTCDDLNRLSVVEGYSRVQFEHWSGRSAYLNDESNWMKESRELAPLLEPTRHAAAYVRECLEDVAQLQSDVGAYSSQLREHIASLEAQIRSHLWVTSDFVKPASVTLERTRADVAGLLARVNKVHSGIRMLPVDVVRRGGDGGREGDEARGRD